MIHIPVLQKEVLEYLDPKPNENFIDCTIGMGGHTFAILEKNRPKGKVLGIDWTIELIESLRAKVKSLKLDKRSILVCNSFANLKEIVKQYNFRPVHGILFDLGMSSWHLEKSRRGFSFQREEPLDMRYHVKSKILTAEKIINEWSEKTIENILREYGQERFARRISKEIVKERKINPIKTTFQLVKILKRILPTWYQHRKIHFATKTFQALRIATNDELENLKRGISQALKILEPKGRLVVISFQSLEDRICKNFLKQKAKEGLLEILTKRPIRPQPLEIKINPRSRSAKLRAIIKL